LEIKEAKEIIDETCDIAKQMGAYMFGFSPISDRRVYTDYTPFRLTGYINSGVGIGLLSGSNLRVDGKLKVCGDYYLCLLNAYHHRFYFQDLRYGFKVSKTFRNRGGLASIRTIDVEKESYEYLRSLFGDAIRLKYSTNHSQHRAHPYQKLIITFQNSCFAS